ncbi:MAG: IS4 family transposase [bacterium]
MGHNFRLYNKFLSIISIDSTFIKTKIRESGIYSRKDKRENGIKMHTALFFPLTIPLEAIITPANISDSSMFDEIIENIDGNILKGSILVFDLGYYDSERFKILDEMGILFVTRIKSNVKYEIISRNGNFEIIRLSNGCTLRFVMIEKCKEEYEYITNIYDLPDEYIEEIYGRRWSIEGFFKIMKKYLKLNHFMSRKINGIMIQIFLALIAYLILLMIQSSLNVYRTLPEIIRAIRNEMVIDPFSS